MTLEKSLGGEEAEEAYDAYSPDHYINDTTIPTVAAYAQYMGDLDFTCPQHEYAALISLKIQGNAYLYRFDHLVATDPVFVSGVGQAARIRDPKWSSHGSEISFVFGTFVSYRTFKPIDDKTLTEQDID